MERRRNAYKILVGKSKEEMNWGAKHKWEDN